MFFRQNSADVDAIAKALISQGGPDGFRVLHHIFPDSPREMNDNFVALALCTLIKFENSGMQIGRAHVCTPVTNAHLVCRLLLENKTERSTRDNARSRDDALTQ